MAGGQWTHDYALVVTEALQIGFKVKLGVPAPILRLMSLYPQPVQARRSVEFLPVAPAPSGR